MLSRFIRGLRTLFAQAVAEHTSPLEVAFSVALGVFCACTPLIGFHMWMALGLATVLRLNRLWALLGSRATTLPILPIVVFSEIELAHRLRTGFWLVLSPHEATAHAREHVMDWFLGTPLVGGAYAAAVGAIAYVLARLRHQRLRQRTHAGSLRPSSGSHPSAPPTTTP